MSESFTVLQERLHKAQLKINYWSICCISIKRENRYTGCGTLGKESADNQLLSNILKYIKIQVELPRTKTICHIYKPVDYILEVKQLSEDRCHGTEESEQKMQCYKDKKQSAP